ncbi:MAG: monovalent cation/H(+) antiporter subunit G [Pseudohongiellaceae bacterium]
MMWFLDIASALFLGIGSLLMLTGAVGVLRFPDFYTRMHAAGVTETLAAALILVGLMPQAASGLMFSKLFLILLLILLTSPTSGHALAKAAIHSRLKPQLGQTTVEPLATDTGVS